jgi:hypothetical protein
MSTTKVLGDRTYPCCHKRHTKTPDEIGTYSRRCPRCGTYWLLIVEVSQLAEQFPGFNLLRMRWATKRDDKV